MVVLARIASQNSGCMWIIFDYDAAPASYLLTIDLTFPLQMLLLIFVLPSGQLAGTYINAP